MTVQYSLWYVVPNTLPVGDLVTVTRSPTGNVLGTTYHKLYCTVISSWRRAKVLPETRRAKFGFINKLLLLHLVGFLLYRWYCDQYSIGCMLHTKLLPKTCQAKFWFINKLLLLHLVSFFLYHRYCDQCSTGCMLHTYTHHLKIWDELHNSAASFKLETFIRKDIYSKQVWDQLDATMVIYC